LGESHKKRTFTKAAKNKPEKRNRAVKNYNSIILKFTDSASKGQRIDRTRPDSAGRIVAVLPANIVTCSGIRQTVRSTNGSNIFSKGFQIGVKATEWPEV